MAHTRGTKLGPYRPRQRLVYDTDWLQCEMARRGFKTHEAFANHIGVRRATVGDILSDTRGMSVGMAARWARGLNCMVSDFLHHDQQPLAADSR